ncbi:hypothetical protein BGZ98_009167 [Dissophora globulifera]|nr:hypothetical protein BGZ98_009167 [Dissophora globulifera]
MAMYPAGQFYDSTQTSTSDMAPDLTHSAMSTQSDMDLDSRSIEVRMHQLQQPHLRYPQPPAHQHQPAPQQQQLQQQQQQQQAYYQSNIPGAQYEPQPYAHQPNPYYNQTQQSLQATECLPMSPSAGYATEMPSLAFSDDNTTMSRNMEGDQPWNPAMARNLPSPAPGGAASDNAESLDAEYFVATVLNMIPAPRITVPPAKYDYHEFTQRQLIAKGGNGEIRRAYWPQRQTFVILKSLIGVKYSAEKIRLMFNKEFYGVAVRNSDDERNGQQFMVMQFHEHGDLVKLMETPSHEPEAPTLTDRLYLAMDIAQGLDHLFKCGFHHGDLHPKNILIDIRRGGSEGAHGGQQQQGRYLARLTDFGLRRIRGNMNEFSSQQFGGVWQFMAPERMLDPKHRPRYDVRCDIFALGVIYWFIMSGRYPFKDPSLFYPGAREARIEGTPNWYHNLYTQAWSEDPNARQQTIDEIVQIFRYNLGIHAPSPTQYLDPNHAHHNQYSTAVSHGYDGTPFSAYSTYDGQHSYLYSGSSGGGSTIRGSPMLTPTSMLTPISMAISPPSSSSRSNNPNHPRYKRAAVPNGTPGSIYRQ